MKNKSNTDVFTERFNLNNKEKNQICRKSDKKAYDKTFHKEFNCLLFFDRLVHSNIIFLRDFYTYEEKHNFLFFSYELNLRTFLQSELRFEDFSQDFTFFSTLRGLASAL